jgi:hypothetical protein
MVILLMSVRKKPVTNRERSRMTAGPYGASGFHALLHCTAPACAVCC